MRNLVFTHLNLGFALRVEVGNIFYNLLSIYLYDNKNRHVHESDQIKSKKKNMKGCTKIALANII